MTVGKKQFEIRKDIWKKLHSETTGHFITALQFDDEKSYKNAQKYFNESIQATLSLVLEEIETGYESGNFYETLKSLIIKFEL